MQPASNATARQAGQARQSRASAGPALVVVATVTIPIEFPKKSICN
jgi:hypothetical protein